MISDSMGTAMITGTSGQKSGTVIFGKGGNSDTRGRRRRPASSANRNSLLWHSWVIRATVRSSR